jgi:cytoskeletal protein CcmA (bactofilin family)
MHLPMTTNLKKSILIKGELSVEEDLTVEGRVEGKIELKDHDLWISPHGTVKAEIHAKSVIIAGDVVGSIFASELVEIRLSGSAQGNIQCRRVLLVDGAKFTGRIDTERTADLTAGPGLPKAQSAKMGQGPS